MLLRKQPVPFGAGHHLGQVGAHEGIALIFNWLRRVEDVAQVLLLNARIVVDEGLVPDGSQSLQVEVEVEISSNHRNLREDL